MKGEFYGQAIEDPEIMRTTNAQDLNRISEGVGVVGGALDAVLPGMAARSLVGAGLRAPVNAGARALGGMALEGVTETGQGEVGRQVRGVLNPEQDTSGFGMDRLNEFAAGAIGGAPISGGAAVADSLYSAGRSSVQRAGDLAGTTMDLLGEKAGPAVDAAKDFAAGVRGKVVDMKPGDVAGKLKEASKAATSGWQARREEMDLIAGVPPNGVLDDSQATNDWWESIKPARNAKVAEKMRGLAEAGDERAAEMLQGIDPETGEGIDDAADYLVDNLRVSETARAAERAGDMLGKVLRGTGKVAGEFGKATWDAARKKNAQRTAADDMQGEVLKSKPGTQFDVDAASNSNVVGEALDVFEAKANSLRRAKLMGEYLSEVAKADKARYSASRATLTIPALMKDVGGELSDMMENWTGPTSAAGATQPSGPTSSVKAPADSRGQQFDGLVFNLNRIATQLAGAYGPKAAQIAADLRNMAGEDKAAFFDVLDAQVAQVLDPAKGRITEATRRAAAEELLKQLPQEVETRLLAEGINLRSDEGKRQLLGMVEAIVTGRVKPEARRALAKLVGEDALTDMAEALATPAQDTTKESSMFGGSMDYEEALTDNGLEMTDDGDIVDSFETKQAEKNFAKGSGTKYYGFAKRPTISNSDQVRDPFSYTERLSKEDWRARAAAGDELPRRPSLLKKGDTLSTGESAIDNKVKAVERKLGVDQGKNFRVAPQRAADMMDDMGMQPLKRLQLFRDYMMQEGKDVGGEQGKAMQDLGRLARKVLLDEMDGGKGGRTSPKEKKLVRRATEKYFNERFVVVGESMSDLDPDDVSAAEIDKLKERGTKAFNEARKARGGASVIMDKDNLLTFQKDGKPVYIKGGDLAGWSLRTQRERTASDLSKNDARSADQKDREFVQDMMTGIAALISSGSVDGLPTRMSEAGTPQSFANGVPDNLLMPSGNRYANLRTRSIEGTTDLEGRDAPIQQGPQVPLSRARRARADDVNAAVVAEQSRDWFVPDEEIAKPKKQPVTRSPEQTAKLRAKGMGYDDTVTAIDDGNVEDEATFEAQRRTSREQGFDVANPTRLDRSADKTPAASPKEGEAPVGKSRAAPSGAATWTDGGRKLNAQASAIHNDLQRPGFAATHDSPYRFDGRFNWRKNKLKGEGAMVFGAGTYLSTGDGVHAYYKKAFTAKAAQVSGTKFFVEIAGTKITVESDDDYGIWMSDGHKNVAQELVAMRLADGSSPAEAVQYAIDAAYQRVDKMGRDLVDVVPDMPDAIANALLTRKPITAAPASVTKAMNVERWNKVVAAAEKTAADARAIDPATIKSRREGDFGAGIAPTYQVSVKVMKAQLMMWDKGFAEQSGPVKRALKKASEQFKLTNVRNTANIKGDVIEYEIPVENQTGEEIYKGLARALGSMELASEWLQAEGVLGHEYAAANGRNGKTPNYVIYDDAKIETNFVQFNKQSSASDAQGQPSTMEERAMAVEYVKKVLGPKIKVQFEKDLGYSGEWVDAADTMRIATTAGPGAMQVAYHEALHAFFGKFIKNNPAAFEAFKELADNQPLLQRVNALLAGHPEAQAQLVDGEERLAYMYQFWSAGMLDLPYGKPKTLFQKVKKFFRNVMGMVSNTERAVDILHAFHAGKLSDPSAAGQVISKAMSESLWARKGLRKMDAVTQRIAALTMPAESILGTSRSKAARDLGRAFYANPGEAADGQGETGYLNAREQMGRRYTNEFSRVMAGMTERDYTDIAKYMNQGVEDLSTIAYEPHRTAVKELRKLLKRFREYMVDERGMDIGDQGPLYFPRVWNAERLIEKRDDFMAMMAAKYPDQNVDAVYNALTQNLANDLKAGRPRDEDGVLAPMNRSGEERVFSWMAPADAAPFLETSLVGIMTRYFHEGARAAEYTHRFGQEGQFLNAKLEQVSDELKAEADKMVKAGELDDADAAKQWHARQMRDISQSVGAMEGTLGKDINGAWRSTNSWVTVYQNVRLLPLSLFASVVDPLGLYARGADFKDATEAFTRGITEVGRTWANLFRDEPKARQADKWERLAEYVGSVDAAIFDTQVSDMYASVYMNANAKAINDKFFKLNGMEGWNRGMRVGATRAAVKFIERHSKLPESHSTRWLDELGLKPADITLDNDGNMLVSVPELMVARGISKEQARVLANTLHTAINRWVTGAVLTPNAAQRPAWSSDPHYSMFFHLKQFTYSFHQTIIKRVYNEMQQGNLAPLGTMAWYIPVMIASDITKGVIQGGGELPAHMKGMDAGEWILYGAERGGIMGLGTLGLDAGQDLSSIGGPAVEQIIDSFSDPLERTMIKAAPAHAIYADWVR